MQRSGNAALIKREHLFKITRRQFDNGRTIPEDSKRMIYQQFSLFNSLPSLHGHYFP